MEIKPYFEKIEDVIVEDIKASKTQLLIAVAWFTNHTIFDALIEKLNENCGFIAKLIVINDNINNRPGGLDFQKFVSAGGCFYFAEKNIPMHNKYMVIDSDIVITGSYNYTYYAETLNDENVVRIIGDGNIVQSYTDNFNSLVSKKPKVTGVVDYLRVNPPAVDLFAYNNYALKDISLQTTIFNQMGNTSEAQNPMMNHQQTSGIVETLKSKEIVETNETIKKYGNFVINNVIYKQWKDNYYIDKIEVRANIIKVLYRTTISDGSWLCSPKTLNAWIIRSSNNKDIISESYAVRDVFINSEMVISEATPGTLYHFYENNIPTSFHLNAAGYDEDKTNRYRPIDSNGNLVPIEFVKTPKNGILTCEVCFLASNLELINGTIDFLEGDSGEKKGNHWNAFNVHMNLNRESL